MRDLRVGVVCHDSVVFAWQARTLADIARLDGVTITKVWRLAGADGYSAAARRASALACADMPALTENPTADVDVVVNLTRAPSPLTPPLGVLRLTFADARHPGAVEVKTSNPVSRAELHLQLAQGETVVGRHVARTARNATLNCDRLLLGSTYLFARALRGMRAGVTLDAGSAPPPQRSDLTARLRRRLDRVLEKTLWRTRWTVGFAQGSAADVIASQRLPDVTFLSGAPAGRFLADPFPLPRDGDSHRAWVEDAEDHPPYKGRIAEIRFDDAGKLLSLRAALGDRHHYSFPFPLRDRSVDYCVPECWESGRLRVFRRDDDGALREDGVLLDGFAAVDPVLCFHEGKWWLFACDRNHDDTTHLYLFHADTWRGPWTPHVLNPVKSDVRCSRPAGAIIEKDGVLYRPAQDCSTRYGGAIAMNRITALTTTAFAEETVFRIEPQSLGPQYVGVHTLNSRDGLLMIDALERRFFTRA